MYDVEMVTHITKTIKFSKNRSAASKNEIEDSETTRPFKSNFSLGAYIFLKYMQEMATKKSQFATLL